MGLPAFQKFVFFVFMFIPTLEMNGSAAGISHKKQKKQTESQKRCIQTRCLNNFLDLTEPVKLN